MTSGEHIYKGRTYEEIAMNDKSYCGRIYEAVETRLEMDKFYYWLNDNMELWSDQKSSTPKNTDVDADDNTVLQFGKYSGKTFAVAYKTAKNYCDWCLQAKNVTETSPLYAFVEYIKKRKNGVQTEAQRTRKITKPKSPIVFEEHNVSDREDVDAVFN
jgi:late competence protein required for DNA uptake (superfamily II DNA/RNA helicase)